MASLSALATSVAYFSMEVGLDSSTPAYAGGLGVLAGDSLRSAADLGIPMVGITLLYHKGYFLQHLDDKGNQTESIVDWDPGDYLDPLTTRVSVTIEDREVWISAWRYMVLGVTGKEVPVYFLDTAVPGNSPWDQSLTDYLYRGDDRYRLCQEVVLGLGGVSMLRALGYTNIKTYHMNEGHSSLLTLALLLEEARKNGSSIVSKENIERVRSQCVFTTHTPVPAGIDKFPLSLVRQIIGEEMASNLKRTGCLHDDTLNMIFLALFFSRYINGVSLRHEEISHDMFPSYPINSVTNGVHAVNWTSEHFRHLYDRYIPEWRHDNLYLRYIIHVPVDEISQAHNKAKQKLLEEVKKRTGVNLNPFVMTLGFARRMTVYKRAELLFSDRERLKKIALNTGPLQIIYSGKAHPQDEDGKALIKHIFEAADALRGIIEVVYLEEYDMTLAKYLCSGVDLWLNTPQKPYEASGTSGMKAALNGVPSLSILDGWWVEGHVEGITGWSIGGPEQESNNQQESASLYNKLEKIIIPLFYKQPGAFNEVRRFAIALNGSYYNAQRMMFQYMEHAYMMER